MKTNTEFDQFIWEYEIDGYERARRFVTACFIAGRLERANGSYFAQRMTEIAETYPQAKLQTYEEYVKKLEEDKKDG